MMLFFAANEGFVFVFMKFRNILVTKHCIGALWQDFTVLCSLVHYLVDPRLLLMVLMLMRLLL